ncbi:MAG: phosphoribosyltransferase family protein [Candidatus Thorarchaeota archaeon]|nr:phosphoribosyltransferase family protein [Candidatus Thorarchaeota archaeon]
MKEYDVVLGSGAEHLQSRFEELGFRVYTSDLNYDYKRMFPNADIYVKIGKVAQLSGRRVIVVQSCTGSGPAENEQYSTSDRIVELLLLLDMLSKPLNVEKIAHKQYSSTPIPPPKSVEVVLTFQPFALQDKSFETGEASSGRWAIETIAKNCNKVFVVSPHAPDSLEWVRKLKDKGLYKIIDVIPDLVDFAKREFRFKDCVVIAPDEGAQERYKIDGFGKSRTNSFKVELHGDLDVNGLNVIVIDDLTKSGSTLLKARDRLLEQGAKEVVLAVAHVVPLLERGEELLERLIEKCNERIVTSNTVNTEIFSKEHQNLCYNIVDTLVETL